MIVAAALILVAGFIGGLVWRSRSVDRLLRDRRTSRVLIELHSGETFQGVLVACDSRSVTLGSVSLLTGTERSKVDGDLLIPRVDVKFIQRP